MNDLELQRWLTSQLPEQIALTKIRQLAFWMADDDQKYVTDREWDRVVRMVEAKLADGVSVKYRLRLMFLSDGPKACYSTVEEALCFATWQQRTRALREVLK